MGPARHQARFPLTTRSSRVSNWSMSRRISTSPLWVSLEVGRLHGSFCCCSMISRPWRGRAAQAHPGSGISGHQEPKCSLSSLPSQPFPFSHTFASAILLTSKALPQPCLSIFHPLTLQHKPCLLQKAFMNFTFTHKSILLLIAPCSLSWDECGVVKKAQVLRHLLDH